MYEYVQSQKLWFRRLTLILVTIILLLSLRSKTFLSIFRYNPTFYLPPGYLLPQDEIQVANEIIDIALPGPMLAPPEISGLIPIFSSNHPQIRIQENEVYLWLTSCGRPMEVSEARIGAANFISGKPKYFDEFQSFLARLRY